MTTRERLVAMTDPGQFECIAVAALRKLDPDCAAVIHHGVNAEGKTVKALVDAWCLVPRSDPPRFVYIAATTNKADGLSEKWLFDHRTYAGSKTKLQADDGDVLKAARAAEQLRGQSIFAAAQFRLILATNQLVGSELQASVYGVSKELGFDPWIFEQTQLADYLDSNGQYLRKVFLGVEADLLSHELLKEIGRKSCSAHANEFLQQGSSQPVPRSAERHIDETLQDQSRRLIYLLGAAGFGKSTTANAVLSSHLASEGCGIWLSAEIVETSTSLGEALTRAFRSVCPGVEATTMQSISSLLPDQRSFLILVDDVNRARDPRLILRKLQAWSAPEQTESGKHRELFRLLILCPVWPQVLNDQQEYVADSSALSVVSVEAFTPEEALAVIRSTLERVGLNAAEPEIRDCASRLNHDPFLIGLFTKVITRDTKELRALTGETVERFLKMTLMSIKGEREVRQLVSDFHKCLNGIARLMIAHRDLRPAWAQLREWLRAERSDLYEAAELLRRDGTLCHITHEEVFVFRHDRLQQHFLAKAVSDLLSDEAVTGEPFFADLLGRSLLCSSSAESLIAKLIEQNPLALFEAISEFGEPRTSLHSLIVDAATAWVKKEVVHDTVPRSLLYAVAGKLMETNSQLVLDFARYFEPIPSIQMAMLRNGDALGGVGYCARLARADFPPAVGSPWRDQMIQIARSRHATKMISQLKKLLADPTLPLDLQEGSLLMAGYMEAAELTESAFHCWSNSPEKARILPEATWAIMHCCDEGIEHWLDPIMDFWSTLGERPTAGENLPPKQNRASVLARGLRRPIRDKVVQYLIKKRRTEPKLDSPLRMVIHDIDSPLAVEEIVEDYAKDIRRGAKGFVLGFLSNSWDPSRHGGRNLSEKSRQRLRQLWQCGDIDHASRTVAFEMWCWSAARRELPLLQAIDDASPLYRKAIHRRALLRDFTVEFELAKLLRREIWLASIAHHVWGPNLFEATETALTKLASEGPAAFNESRHIAEDVLADLLSHIPHKDATTLFAKHAAVLKTKAHFVQAALFIGTPECMRIADESIREKLAPDVFEHIGIRASMIPSALPSWSVERFLKRIEVYLPDMPPDDAECISWICHTPARGEWMQNHLLKFLTPQDRKKLEWSDESITAQLDSFVGRQNDYSCVYYLVDHAKRRGGVGSEQLVGIASEWFRHEPTFARYKILCDVVAQVGTRKDLQRLDNMPIGESSESVERARKSAEFELKRRTLA